MIPNGLVSSRSEILAPNRIAEVCAGRVLRGGEPAGRLVTDSRKLGPGDCFVALRGERFDGHEFLAQAFEKGAVGAVVSEPVSQALLRSGVFVVRVPDTYAALLEMARAYRNKHSAKIVGITGSCGKTSTKDMLGSVLERVMPTIKSPQSYNNHIGVPLTLFQLREDTKAAVVEIGTNAPGEIEVLASVVQPDISIVTRVDESHLLRFRTIQGVAVEKAGLVAALREDGLAVINGDDQSSEAFRGVSRARLQEVRIDHEADWFATDISFHGLGTSFRLQGELTVTLPRLGSHNVYNALFTVAAASELGVPIEDIIEGLCESALSPRRLERKQVGEISLIDDTYNSNPASARAALVALTGLPVKGRRLVVIGDMLELGESSERLHRSLGVEVAHSGVDVLVTVGEEAADVADSAVRAGMKAVHHLGDLQEAIDFLVSELRSGDWLLAKASRALGLDRLVDDLQDLLGE